VNFSVKAQDFLVKQGLNQIDGLNRTTDDMFQKSLLGTTEASQNVDNTRYNSMSKFVHLPNPLVAADKSYGEIEGFQLPSIKQGSKGSPFKGFLDISIVT